MKKKSIYYTILLYQFIYVVISAPFIALTRYTITTPDTFNYLLIAEQLAQGRFYEAISGHWSIGISILIAPLMALGVDGILAFKIINTLIGFFTLTLFLRIITRTDDFSRRKTPSGLTAKVVSTAIAFIIILPLTLSMTLELTPDLLLTTLLLWYLKILLQSCLAFSKYQMAAGGLPLGKKGVQQQNYGWFCGLIAGIAFWAKAYTLPFFVVHFAGWNMVLLLVNYYFHRKKQYNNEGKKITGILKLPAISSPVLIRNFILGVFVFVLISTPYILALSSKFGGFSIGTSGAYNFALISPHRSHDQLTKNELINPQTQFTDFWAYEEPALFVESWSPFASASDIRYYTEFLASNVLRFCYFDYARHLIIFLIISILFIFYRKIKLNREECLFIGLMVFTAAVFTSGYFLVLVRERYFWLDNFIGLIVLFFIGKIFYEANAVHPPTPPESSSGQASKGGGFSLREKLLVLVSPPSEGAGGWTAFTTKLKKTLPLIIAFAAGLLIYDSIEMIQTQSSKQAFYKNLHEKLPELQALNGQRIATNDTWGAYHHTDVSVYLMYKLRYQFWGQIRTTRLKQEGLKEAKENNIDYFILWESPDLEQSIFKNEQVIFQDTFSRMVVYKINN